MKADFPVIDSIKTGKRIRSIMDARGLTVPDVQRYLGLATTQAVYHWLRGRSLPSIDNMYALSILFDVPVDEILCGSGKRCFKDKQVNDRVRCYVRKFGRYTAA